MCPVYTLDAARMSACATSRGCKGAGCSFTAKIFYEFHEVVEEVVRIVRSGRGLRMILDAEHRLAAMPETFQRLIVQVDVRQLHFTLVQRIGVHREAVIVGGDLNLLRHVIQHGMIRAAVPELELVSLAAHREAKNLMAQADAEDGLFADEIADLLGLILQRLRIAGAVREEHSIRIER